jgi:hypothetical protein
MPESAGDLGDHCFASCDSLVEFVVHSNLTDYADNAFDGCYYMNYDSVTINVEDNSTATLAIVAAALVVVGVIAILVYNKKQKKLQILPQSSRKKRAAAHCGQLKSPDNYFQYSRPLSSIPAFFATNTGFLPSAFCLQ